MKIKSFGLDIGTTTMKAVCLRDDKELLALSACLSGPTPPKGMVSESPIDQEEMAQAIRKLIADANIQTKDVHISLADSQTFTKVIDMPKLSEKELSSAIYWEAEQYIPAKLQTMTLDWKVLQDRKELENETTMQVLLVAAQTQLIEKYQDICQIAGLSIVSIETEILSVVRSVLTGGNFPTSLIVNIGALSTSLAIVQNGIIVFTYSIPLGGVAINRAIAADFGFSPSQAEEYKKTYGIADQDVGGKISKAIEPILRSVLSEIKKALVFYNEKFKNKLPVTQILLSGGTAKLPGIDLFFANNTGIETVMADPWKMQGIQGVPKELHDIAGDYAIAVGLALKDYE